MLLGIVLLFIFLHQPPEPLESQGLRGRLLAPGRFQTSSPWSRPQTSGGTRTRSRIWFVAIRPLSDESLDFGHLIGCLQLRLFATPVFRVTVLNCPRLHRAVVFQVCQAIVCSFAQPFSIVLGFTEQSFVKSAGQSCATLVGRSVSRFLLV